MHHVSDGLQGITSRVNGSAGIPIPPAIMVLSSRHPQLYISENGGYLFSQTSVFTPAQVVSLYISYPVLKCASHHTHTQSDLDFNALISSQCLLFSMATSSSFLPSPRLRRRTFM